jgi:hypothetical protein
MALSQMHTEYGCSPSKTVDLWTLDSGLMQVAAVHDQGDRALAGPCN